MIRFSRLFLICVGFALLPLPSLADTSSPDLHFVVNITPRLLGGVPWTGELTFRVSPDGIINGTYKSTSVKPDPFYGKIITVTGALSQKNIRLEFGLRGNFAVDGTYEPGVGIVGTALSARGAWYDFVAKQVK